LCRWFQNKEAVVTQAETACTEESKEECRISGEKKLGKKYVKATTTSKTKG
jgi:hypothetical protein